MTRTSIRWPCADTDAVRVAGLGESAVITRANTATITTTATDTAEDIVAKVEDEVPAANSLTVPGVN